MEFAILFLQLTRVNYSKNIKVLFVVNSEMSSLGRMDAYLSNMKFPWESERGEEVRMPVGSLECWVKNSEGYFSQDWTKTYNS
jgi:hypothetical protein